MSKATLEFDLTDFDDRMEFERVNKATDMALIIWEMVYNTRKNIEWDLEKDLEDGKTLTVFDGVDVVFSKLIEKLNEKGIIIDNLIV
jgi:hypothetical protein